MFYITAVSRWMVTAALAIVGSFWSAIQPHSDKLGPKNTCAVRILVCCSYRLPPSTAQQGRHRHTGLACQGRPSHGNIYASYMVYIRSLQRRPDKHSL